MQDGESWASAFLVVVGIEKNDNYLLHYRVSFRQKPEKPRICFPSLRLAFHSYKAFRERVLNCFIWTQSCGTMCHSENRYGDKQNKNRWCTQTAHWEYNIVIVNRMKTVGDCKTVDTTCKTNTSITEKTVGDCKIPIIFNLQHNNDENVTSIITHNRVKTNLRHIRNP